MARAIKRSAVGMAARSVYGVWAHPVVTRLRGAVFAGFGLCLLAAFASYHVADPSFDSASGERPHNLMGQAGADAADLALQNLGLCAWLIAFVMVVAGGARLISREPSANRGRIRVRALWSALGALTLAGLLAAAAPPATWPLAQGLGGFWGELLLSGLGAGLAHAHLPAADILAPLLLGVAALLSLGLAVGLHRVDFRSFAAGLVRRTPPAESAAIRRRAPQVRAQRRAKEIIPPAIELNGAPPALEVKAPRPTARESAREARENQGAFEFVKSGGFRLPELAMLAKPKPRSAAFDEGALRQNARLLESVLAEFGVRGTVDQIRPGPVVTLYELSPAPGVKSARVVALSDDIARSMSVAACRVSVVQGRNAIGIELPNAHRETVYLRDLLSAGDFEKASQALPLALGETIGGEPYIADLAKMPHLLIAGTTGSGKSVGVNAMILSILYRHSPDQCRFIMIDPKMLELSVYDGIPHLLAPVVTDPKKAVVALKWTVREMEDRYRRMSKIGVRNVAGYNERALEAQRKGEHFVRTVQTGFDADSRPIYEEEKLNPEPMPYLVVVIDEMADLMLVAGKEIEGAVQRLAQMARAAGIHLITATQRPSVDVITGTIKANFPTRISFQVTSKIDSRTILGEQGGEQLLGQGDMLYMAGGGRITRLHGPFVSDGEVEAVARFLREQGEPQYLEEVTAAPEGDEEGGVGLFGEGGSGDDLYDRAVAVVTRDGKASTSYIQRRLQIGYNRAASLMERMEQEGVVGPANHAGKREILASPAPV
ncbi:MAG TPA: DNA translocase FtsK 4TM domain-containing protein [Caulobacteraceae bacterium]|nr:DNA translocase FtsK 4TM domain-containing protein [Caulobacteraceae bacterium]